MKNDGAKGIDPTEPLAIQTFQIVQLDSASQSLRRAQVERARYHRWKLFVLALPRGARTALWEMRG